MTGRLVVGLTALLAAAACTSDSRGRVALEAVIAGTVTQTVAAPATIDPLARAAATAPTSGAVAEVYVRDGQAVRAGARVLRLASAEPALAVAQAEAGLQAARALATAPPAADLSPLLAAMRNQLDLLAELVAAIEREGAAIPNPTARAAIARRLATARARHQRASRELYRVESRARATTRQASAAQQAAASAQQAQAEAAVAAARAREEALTVVAPISGVVELEHGGASDAGPAAGAAPPALGLLATSVGAPVTVGARVVVGQPLFHVYDLSGFQVAARVDEVDAVLVAPGQPATVLLDAHPERRFAGTVGRVGVAPAAASSGGVVYGVAVAFRPPPSGVAVRVGMTASVEIAVRRVRSDTVVPARALLRRAGRDVVLVARGGRVHAVRVTLLAVAEEQAAVEGALQAGEQVVVSGTDDLDDGDLLAED